MLLSTPDEAKPVSMCLMLIRENRYSALADNYAELTTEEKSRVIEGVLTEAKSISDLIRVARYTDHPQAIMRKIGKIAAQTDWVASWQRRYSQWKQ